MPTDHILALLVQERDKLNRAIESLQGSAKRRGRPPKNPLAGAFVPAAAASTPRKRKGGMSSAARKAQSQRMKAYWAAKRKNKGKK
jgi:hypothetical protein